MQCEESIMIPTVKLLSTVTSTVSDRLTFIAPVS